MSRVNFAHAFERWYGLTEREHAWLKKAEESRALLSWEALDHLCGLTVESGMKALLLRGKFVAPDADGDYPPGPGPDKRRPHVDALFEVFLSMAQGRRGNDWVSRLAGGKGTPPLVFNAWRSEHRYAPDGTVDKTIALERLKFAKRLKVLITEEGAA
jgi:hypothetical protein